MGVYYIGSIPCSGGDIYHFGRKGMKWGQTIFGDLADRLAKRGWTGASNVARGISTGFGRANEFINADQARANLQRSNRMGPTYQMDTATRNAAQAAYNRTLPGMIDRARGAVGNAASAAREQAQQAMAKAREKVSTAYADAAAAIGRKGLDIQSFYSQVMQKAQGAINQGKDMVRQYGGMFVSQIQNLGSKALEGGKAFLDNAMERARNAGRQIGEAAGNAREFVTGEKARKKRDRDRSIYEKNSAAYEQEQSKKTKSPWSASHKSIVDKSKKRADESQAEYERTLPGMIERTTRDAGEAISRAGRKAKKAKREATNYITGNRARLELNRAKAAERGANTQHRLASRYDYEDVDNNGSVLNRASRDDYYAREQRARAQAEYDKTLPGQIEKARKKRKK